MPQASVLTSTCPEAGFGSGSVSTTISPFLKMAARIGVSFAFLLLPGSALEAFTTYSAQRPCRHRTA